MRELVTEMVVVNKPWAVIGAELPVVPADASPALAEGLTRRRTAALEGACPCGAKPQLAGVEPDGRLWQPAPHPPDCPAHDDRLGPELAAWQTARPLRGRRGGRGRRRGFGAR